MKQTFKLLAAVAAVAGLAGSAQAIPTLLISDGVNSITVTDVSGIIHYSSSASGSGWNAADKWNLVITTGIASPPAPFGGTVTFPSLDLSIQASSVGGAGVLSISVFNTGYGPTSGSAKAQLTGNLLSGTAGGINLNTFYSTANDGATTGVNAHSITTSGTITPGVGGVYSYTGSGSLTAGAPYSLTEVVTIDGRSAASYSLDGSTHTVPDGGTTLVLLGSALSSLALLRKRFVKA